MTKRKKGGKRKRPARRREPREGVTEVYDRNRSGHAGRRGGAALEESATGKPSRKSTRGSSDRTKRTTNLQLRAMLRSKAPSSRRSARRH
jgi:hypothetical protein